MTVGRIAFAEETIAPGLLFSEGGIVQMADKAVEHRVAGAVEGVGILRARIPNAADEEREWSGWGHWLDYRSIF